MLQTTLEPDTVHELQGGEVYHSWIKMLHFCRRSTLGAELLNSCLHNFIMLESSRWYIGSVNPMVFYLLLHLSSYTSGPSSNWNPMTTGLLCRSCHTGLTEAWHTPYVWNAHFSQNEVLLPRWKYMMWSTCQQVDGVDRCFQAKLGTQCWLSSASLSVAVTSILLLMGDITWACGPSVVGHEYRGENGNRAGCYQRIKLLHLLVI